jgi:hypothetical protein
LSVPLLTLPLELPLPPLGTASEELPKGPALQCPNRQEWEDSVPDAQQEVYAVKNFLTEAGRVIACTWTQWLRASLKFENNIEFVFAT